MNSVVKKQIEMRKIIVILSVIFSVSLISCAQKAEKKTKKTKVTFIELGSVRCIPCRKMEAVLEKVRKEYPNDVKVIFYDVWTEAGKPFAKQYGVKTIPTQVFLDETGKEYFRHVGYFPEKDLIKILKQKGVKN